MITEADTASFLPLKNDVLHICLTLASGPLHGYAIMRDAEQQSGGAVRLQLGALYRTLHGLLEQELIVRAERPASDSGNDPRRRYYQLTALGRRVLLAELARMESIVRAARRIVPIDVPGIG